MVDSHKQKITIIYGMGRVGKRFVDSMCYCTLKQMGGKFYFYDNDKNYQENTME